MGFLNSLFGSDESNPAALKLSWNHLTDLGGLNEIIVLSEQQPVLIFKHSTRCSISRMALKQFENEFNLQDKIAIYYLDLLEFRSISNEIASRFKIEHQSPQIVLIKNGAIIHDASHSDIDALKLQEMI